MKALRVLSLLNNNIGEVPLNLGFLDTLKILKIAGNPLKPSLKRVVDGNDDSYSPPLTALADNEKDTLLTRKIKKYLKSEIVAKESGEESRLNAPVSNFLASTNHRYSSDGPLDTPRPLKRNLSLRFPVKPSTSGSELAPDTRSPGFQKPPIPIRSHFRVASGQNENFQTPFLSRPGIAPLITGSERNRSNSESVLQATQNTRNKRMGMVTRKNANLGPLDEVRANRNSLHLRGQSHGSALRDKPINGTQSGDNSSSPSSYEYERQRGTFVRRLSSLPEHKRKSQSVDCVIEGAKGVLYSLHHLHLHISTLIRVIKDGTSKRSSLEIVYHNASTHLEHLDQKIHSYDKNVSDNEEEKGRSNSSVSYACNACIVAYRQVGYLLLRNLSQLVMDGDQKYLRTLILLLYGSLVEARNACLSLGISLEGPKIEKTAGQRIPTIHEENPKPRDRSLTPTREHPNPERRWRNGNVIQQPGNLNLYNLNVNSQNAVPLFINGRSRSNSRTTFNSSTASSVANTPRSGESFPVLGTPMTRSRSNSALAVGNGMPTRSAIADDPEKEMLFEKIFLGLTASIHQALQAIPVVKGQFSRCLKVALSKSTARNICKLWSDLIVRCQFCLDMCNTLKMRLSTIKLHEPSVRNKREFWRMCIKYINSVIDLNEGIRSARNVELVPTELLRIIHPVHVTTRTAHTDINNSPWGSLGKNPDANTPTTNGTQRHRAGESSSSVSPFLQSIPATPLSAALGPAAQATIPSTPASASANFDRSFQGDVFQRADSLLSLQQTMIYRR